MPISIRAELHNSAVQEHSMTDDNTQPPKPSKRRMRRTLEA